MVFSMELMRIGLVYTRLLLSLSSLIYYLSQPSLPSVGLKPNWVYSVVCPTLRERESLHLFQPL